ncbi:MAG TPA: TIGR03960 family B12-binding radical SAM protein [Chloroflexi bacterium]|nr:TIGR03960 family B12-binding radical SAM protein [Chloroflexota bacterium]
MPIDLDRLERILPTVRKPGRYVGGEYNSVVKDWASTPVHVCLAFPDIYDLGMSNLGIAILYDILNRLPDVLAERVYLPWVDMIETMREHQIPLFSLESRRPLREFDVIGISLPYEQLYTNVLEMLDLADVPLASRQRTAQDPLVVAGGHATFNPEAMADFIDAFIIGDGEEAIVDVVRAYRETQDGSREDQLHALARIPGIYVPRFYDARYNADGTVAAIEPNTPGAPMPVRKRVVSPLPQPPTRLLVPNVSVSHDRAAIEIQRGCTRGCRFCHAGMVVRPVRERPVEEILAAIATILRQTGFEEIGLLSLSSSDYSEIGRLVETITGQFCDEHLAISLPALRADSFSVELAEAVAQGRHTGFTFAPEAATERLRAVINKPIPTDEMLDVARDVFERGMRTIKLYFMIGLPGEQMADVEAIADLSLDVWRIGRQAHGRKAQVNVSVNTFVPKPHTPFQWVGLEETTSIREKQALLGRQLRKRGLKFSYNDPTVTLLEAALSRGDRRMGSVIRSAWEKGTRFDAWHDQQDLNAWIEAFGQAGLDPGFYAYRQRSPDEVFPWEVIDVGVSKRFLEKEYRRSHQGETTPDCRQRCHGCGIVSAYGDICSPTWDCPPRE